MSTASVVKWTTRPDLIFAERNSDRSAEASFVVSDPIASEFFLISEFEYGILKLLEFPTSTAELISEMRSRFNEEVSDKELAGCIARLASDNLLVARGLGDGDRLYEMEQRVNRQKWIGGVTGILSVKVPGIYPKNILEPLRPVGWMLFGRMSLFLSFLGLLFTLLFMANHQSQVFSKLPTALELVTLNHIVLLAVGFVVSKILHELGHGLACQKMGYECSEMGILFLVFMPCLYCDVSNMWLEKSRWKRALVAFAGIHIELMIAVVCFWIWFTLPDGHALEAALFSMMLVTSVNTLFVNGNPLMKYDGYYLLSDLCESPNLASRSKETFNGAFLKLMGAKDTSASDHGIGFLIYGVAAFVYRWFILSFIAYAIWFFFDSNGLGNVGLMFVSSLAVLVIGSTLFGTLQMFGNLAKTGLSGIRFAIFLLMVGALGWGFAKYEYNYRIYADAGFELAQQAQVFAPAAGFPTVMVADGEQISAGDIVATVEATELVRETAGLESEKEGLDREILNLKLQPPTSATESEIEFLNKKLESINSQIVVAKSRMESLTIKSPRTGQFIATKATATPDDDSLEISQIDGSLFDEVNQGAYVDRGTLLGYVGEANQLQGTVFVPEYQAQYLKLGQTVRIFCESQKEPLEGTLSNIGTRLEKREANESAPDTANDSMFTNAYRVEFELPRTDDITVGSIHRVSIVCQPMTTTQRLQKWLSGSIWKSGF